MSKSEMPKSNGPWKGIAIVLIVLIIVGGIGGGIFYYMNNQKISNLENALGNTQSELSQTKSQLSQTTSELSRTRSELSQTQILMESIIQNSSSAEALIEEYRANELNNPTSGGLSDFLSWDESNEINYTNFAEWIEQNLILKENAEESQIMTALAIVEYNCEYGGELREGGWTLVLATESDDGEIIYFSAENDEIYYSPEELLNYWTDISNAEVTDITLYW